MGKKRITQVSEPSFAKASEGQGKTPEKKDKTRLDSQKARQVHIAGLGGGQRIKSVDSGPIIEETPPERQAQKKTRRAPKIHGKKYLEAKGKVDPDKLYTLSEGIKLLKDTSTAKFVGSAEVNLMLTKTGIKGDVELPFLQGRTKKVEIASEETLKKLEAGKIDFDVLLSSPAMMPQLAKYAKMLGPKGLMPNPKSGTITENPEKLAKDFEKPKFSYKSEANAPIIHTIFGKVDQPEKELEANISALIKAVGNQNIKKVVIKSTMGPAIKLQLTSQG